jgi:hypothetical protein
MERGAGRISIDRIPYPVEQALKTLEGVKHIVLVGSRIPVAFFAYPDKPSLLAPKDTQFTTLSTIAMIVYPVLVTTSLHLDNAHAGVFLGGTIHDVAQVVGAIVGAGALYLIASGKTGFDLAGGFASNGYGAHSPGGYSLLSGFVCELVLTAGFLFVIMGATDSRAPAGFAPIAIGLALTLIHLISIPITLSLVTFAGMPRGLRATAVWLNCAICRRIASGVTWNTRSHRVRSLARSNARSASISANILPAGLN